MNYYSDSLRQRDHYDPLKIKLKEFSLEQINIITNIYESGDRNTAVNYWVQIQKVADVVIGIDPVTGMIRDIYETFSGKNLITGEQLSTWDYSFAIIGVVTLGGGSKIGRGLKFVGRIISKTKLGRKALKAAKYTLRISSSKNTAQIVESANLPAKNGLRQTRAFNGLETRFAYNDKAFHGLKRTPERASKLIPEILSSKRKVRIRGINHNNQRYVAIYDKNTNRGLRIINFEFDTFSSRSKKLRPLKKLTMKEYIDIEDFTERSGLTLHKVRMAFETAREPYKGATKLAHALHKHQSTKIGRKPHLWGKPLFDNTSTWHEQAMKHYRDIFNGRGKFKQVNNKGINWLEKRLPDGRGIRLQMDGEFKTFVD